MNAAIPKTVRGILFDLDGTLFIEEKRYPGSVEALKRLRQEGLRIGFLSNTTRMSRASAVERLLRLGFEAHDREVVTPTLAAAELFRREGKKRLLPLLAPDTLRDFEGFDLENGKPECVLVGDLGEGFLPGILNRAFLALLEGADLVALQKNRYWKTPEGLRIDAGGYVALLEYCSGKEARVIGKPELEFFQAGLRALQLSAGETAMVGDDLQNDVLGAKRAGLFSVQVRTGKFQESELKGSLEKPELILDSVADLA